MGRDPSDLRQSVGDRAQQRQGPLQACASAHRSSRLRTCNPRFVESQRNRTKRQGSRFGVGQSQESSTAIQRERKKFVLKDVQVKKRLLYFFHKPISNYQENILQFFTFKK